MERKLNTSEFPVSNGISKIPTELLSKIIKIYNDKIDEEYESKILEKYYLAIEGKIKIYTAEEFFSNLEREGLWFV